MAKSMGLGWGKREGGHGHSSELCWACQSGRPGQSPGVGVTARVDAEASRDSPLAGRGAVGKVHF